MSKETNSSSYEDRMVQPKQGVWRTYDAADGLPIGVFFLLQDRQGYLWLGSMNGLYGYDGVNFASYGKEHGPAGGWIMSMCEDHQGRLWFGALGMGVSCYDGSRFVNYTTENGLVFNAVRSIIEDSRGRLWFGTNNGVSCYDEGKFTNYTTEDGLVGNCINTVCEDSQGRIWFGNGLSVEAGGDWKGASCFDGKGFTNYSTEDGLAGNHVTSICTDHQANLWFATSTFGEPPGNGGISRYDGERFVNYTTENGLPNNNVISIYEDKQGRMWFSTHGGACCFDGESFTTYNTADGLLDNQVWDIIQDQEGIFWFAHSHSGLTRFDEKTCQLLAETTVSCPLIQTDEGNLWFGNTNRLYCLSNGRQRSMEFPGVILSLMEGSARHLWVCTDHGLCCYDLPGDVWERKSRHFITDDASNSQIIQCLIEAKDGAIWAGTQGSPGCLCRLDGEKFRAIQTAHPMIGRLLEDDYGRIWMGGWQSGGLTCYQSGQLRNYTIGPGWASNGVNSIVEDNDNRLWIGTFRELHCFDGENFTPHGEKISGHGMYDISAKDAKGHLWFGTSGDGIYRYDGRHFQQLTRTDGLPSDAVTGFVPQPDGSMIIGTKKGIVHYRPTATMPPKVQIREVVADRVYTQPDAPELTTTQASLVTINYHGMSFSTSRMRYSYILEGFDEEWEDTWDSQVRYEKLPAGEYTFKVIAINRDLVESESPAVLKINVVPDPKDEQIAQLEGQLLERERAEMERIHKELEEARQIQLSLLPEKPPEIKGFEIAGISSPAREVSGDFYSYLSLGKSVGIALVDVTGKSVRAAMVATMTDGMLHRGMGNMAHSPAEILRGLNVDLQPRLTHTMFIAMVLGILQPEKKRLILANAGMPYPIMKNGPEARELEISALPLGITEKAEYSELNVDLNDKDFVIFYSDGVIEAENESGEMYQTERLLDLIRQADPSLSVQGMVDLILGDVIGYVGDEEASDDITIVVIRCDGLSC